MGRSSPRSQRSRSNFDIREVSYNKTEMQIPREGATMNNTEHTGGLSARVIEMLEAPIDPDLVRRNDFNPRKPDFEYIDRETVIRSANRILGHDGWSYRIVGEVAFTETPPALRDGRKVRRGFYTAIVSLSVRGVGTRDGVGCWEIAADTPGAHDTAAAASVTRALKRAFSTFGPQFGLDLRSGSGRRVGGSMSPARREDGRRPSRRPGKVGVARVVKEWADSRGGMTVPAVCGLMGIDALGDREVGMFMSEMGMDGPEQIPDELDRLVAASVA